MKVFKRTSLPETVQYNGREYTRDAKLSAEYFKTRSQPSERFVVVEILKDKTDQSNKPASHIYTELNPMYKVFRVYRNSARRATIEKNLTLEQAQRLTQSFPSSQKSMVCFTRQ